MRFALTRYAAAAVFDRWMFNDPSLAALGNTVARELGRAMAQALDTNGFMGDGTAPYAKVIGLFKRTDLPVVTCDTGDNTFAEVIAASTKYLSAVIGKAPDWIEVGAPAWFMSREVFWNYMGVRDTTGHPIADILNVGNKPQRVLCGYNVEVTQVAPKMADSGNSTVMAVFGSLELGATVFRNSQGFEIRVSDELYFLKDQVAMLGIVQQDIAVTDTNAFVQLKTAAS